MIVKQKKQTLSIDLNLITIPEMQILLQEHKGYIDGDEHTLELFVMRN